MSTNKVVSDAVAQTKKTNGTVSSSTESVNTVGIAGASEVVVAPNPIRLRVITSDNTNEVHFRVKEDTRLGRLKTTYSKRLGMEPNVLRFMYDGHRIADDDTPKSLEMIDEDVIEIYQERVGELRPEEVL